MQRKVYREIEQRSEEWRAIRRGRIGSSQCSGVFVKGRSKDGLGAGIQTEIDKAIADIKQGDRAQEEERYTNEYMDRGKHLEEEAIRSYEAHTFTIVEEIGCVTMGNHIVDSPDGWVEEDGCIEVKIRMPHLHEKYLKEHTKEGWTPDCIAQMKWHMFVGERKWCDFISYCPTYPEEQQLVIKRIYLTEEDKAILMQKTAQIESIIKKRTAA